MSASLPESDHHLISYATNCTTAPQTEKYSNIFEPRYIFDKKRISLDVVPDHAPPISPLLTKLHHRRGANKLLLLL